MARIYDNNPESIGNTPLVRLNRVVPGAKATLLGKVEGIFAPDKKEITANVSNGDFLASLDLSEDSDHDTMQ